MGPATLWLKECSRCNAAPFLGRALNWSSNFCFLLSYDIRTTTRKPPPLRKPSPHEEEMNPVRLRNTGVPDTSVKKSSYTPTQVSLLRTAAPRTIFLQSRNGLPNENHPPVPSQPTEPRITSCLQGTKLWAGVLHPNRYLKHIIRFSFSLTCHQNF